MGVVFWRVFFNALNFTSWYKVCYFLQGRFPSKRKKRTIVCEIVDRIESGEIDDGDLY